MTVELWRAAPDVSHLTATAQTAAVLPDAERIARIRAERWIGYSRAREALAKLEDLLTHPVRQRMPNLLLIGPTNNGKSMLNELPRSKLRGINPPLAYIPGPPVWRGGGRWLAGMYGLQTLEQPQLDVLAMQLRIAFVTPLLPHIFANDRFIPMTAYGTDEIPFGPKLASPQTLFDGGDTVEDLTGRETFDDLDDLRRAIARHRLHEKMDMIFVSPNF